MKGKVQRFYWREIFKSECELALQWLHDNGETVQDIVEFRSRFPEATKRIEREARKLWQQRHKEQPKYDLTERTEAEFLSTIEVPTIAVQAKYVQVNKGGQRIGKWLGEKGVPLGSEDFAHELYSSRGYRVLRCERVLISAWIGTFLADVIQDPTDPRQLQCMRHSTRGWSSDNRETPLIHFLLPEDFGTSSYFERRREKLETRFDQLECTASLSRLFDDLLESSELLRDYLWVSEDKAVEIAREALSIIPALTVVAAITWAMEDFFERRSGWPDLLVYRDGTYQFVEVKSPHDRLSQEQMDWFWWAMKEANIPCEILRIRRLKE